MRWRCPFLQQWLRPHLEPRRFQRKSIAWSQQIVFLLGYSGSLQKMQQAMVATVTDVEPQMAMMVAMAGPSTMLNMMVRKENGGMGSGGVKIDGAAAVFVGGADAEFGDPLSGVIFEVADADGLVSAQPTMVPDAFA